MRGFYRFLQELFRSSRKSQYEPEVLRSVFKKRFTSFRSLLTANNNALQAMAELEKMYYGVDSYRMAHIRPKMTTILVNVYKMVHNLTEMSGGRYRELQDILDTISHQIETVIDRKPVSQKGEFILDLVEAGRARHLEVGEKMANLGEAGTKACMNIPPGFVVTASATKHFLSAEVLSEINRRLQVADLEDLDTLYATCEDIQNYIRELPLPADLEDLLLQRYQLLEKQTHPGCLVALRSSALGEDSAGISFAGLYRTVLNVDKDHLIPAYKEIIASKYGAKAIAYRRKRGYRHEDIEMCVGCLAMVDAQISGVTYSNDPTSEYNNVLRIVATSGIAKGVVDGTTPVSLYLVSRSQPHQVIYSEDRGQTKDVQDEPSHTPSLSGIQLQELVEAALKLEEYFGQGQDIEWSFDGQGKLYILQSRPAIVGKETQNVASPRQEAGEQPICSGGICAAAGIAAGEVYRVDSPQDMRDFPQNGVLVLEYPLPDWAPLLQRAQAVLAENGSEAGHLATVAREFGIPALFSLPDITTTLSNGEMVTVDATSCSVYRGSRADILKTRGVKRDLMAGSPVQRLLTEALQYITPLILNDPASISFKASRCETLHDITRFCHEKSVSEMFNFGRNHNFDQGSAKRLVENIPLEWWVINLDDGFRDGIDEQAKAIHIGDIISLPMQAIWRGISAVPWGGPPPVSSRGFGSIILQSAMRPELDPSVPSPLTVKNYFLISKNFCNLSVRLGYHYAMIEAYLSDFLTESYVTFRFKGGAADLRRKAVRARLLAEILKQYGFGVELRSDALLARIKKRSTGYLEQRLMILGYLTLHARQLDMAMNSSGAVSHYREKFLQDIEAMLAAVCP